MRRTTSAVTVAVALLAAAAGGYDTMLDTRAVEQAISLGQARTDAARARTHQPYHLAVAQPPIDYLEVITPFRRIVLAAEGRYRDGQRLLSQRDALALLSASGGTVEIVAELTFHPLNNFIGVPDYTLRLDGIRSAQQTVLPRDIQRIPRFTPRIGPSTLLPIPTLPVAPGSDPLIGGMLVAAFDGRLLGATDVHDVVVEDNGKELARVRLDLGTMR